MQSELSCGIRQEILEVIASNISFKVWDITSETTFMDAGVDSITFIEMIVSIENEFFFEFEEEMICFTAFPTILSMVEYAESKIDENAKDKYS